LDLRLDQLPKVCAEPLVSAFFVGPHKARVACHVGGEDCGKAADRRHLSRSGRFGLTNCNAKTGPTLASRWPEMFRDRALRVISRPGGAPRRLHIAPATQISSAMLWPSGGISRPRGRVGAYGLARGTLRAPGERQHDKGRGKPPAISAQEHRSLDDLVS